MKIRDKAVQYEEQMHDDAEDAGGQDDKAKCYKDQMEYHQSKVYAYKVELHGLRGLRPVDGDAEAKQEEETQENDDEEEEENEESDDDSKANKRQKTVVRIDDDSDES
jgi:hypothetical protein